MTREASRWTNRLRSIVTEVWLRRPQDLAFRVWRILSSRSGLLERSFLQGAADIELLRKASAEASAADAEALLNHIEAGTARRVPGLSVSAIESAHSQSADSESWRNRVRTVADTAVHGEFVIFGAKRRLSRPISWARDPRSGTEWPDEHWSRIQIARGPGVDVKDCWELNRHGYFYALAQAWQWSSDPEYVRTFVKDITSWAAQNPPETGVNYYSNLELGLRALAWINADSVFRESPEYPTEARLTLHANVHAMARHISRNLVYTRWTGPNNHLIGDSASLLVIANRYPVWRDAAAWARQARSILWSALRRQVLDDGMHFERSFGYHAFVLEFALLAVASERAAGADVPDDVAPILSAMADTLGAALQPDGSLPAVNDNDDGRVLPLVDHEPLRLSWLMSWCTATCKDEPPSKPITETADDSPATRHWPRAGWVIGRTHDQWWMLDNHGDPFPDSGHNHASLLQFTCWLDGKPLLVDSGTYRYNGVSEVRDQLRATCSHSTLTIDGRSQAEPSRQFGWRSLAQPGSVKVFERDDEVLARGEHHAYSRFGCRVEHVREVIWRPGDRIWIVTDRVTAQHPVWITQYWHLHPDITPTMPEEGIVRLGSEGRPVLMLRDGAGAPAAGHLIHSDRDTDASPFSPGYGLIVPKWVLRRQLRCGGEATLVTVIQGSTGSSERS